MTTIIITGVSRGLGKALFLQLCGREDVELITLSRNPPPESKNPHLHFFANFSNPAELETTLHLLNEHLAAGKTHIVFISNAGDVRPVKKTGQFTQAEIMQSLHVNYTAPVMITNSLLSLNIKTDFVNISSGAAHHPVEGWAMYCSAKSAAKAFFDVVAKENPAARILQINPGIIDTEMQQEIRNASAEQFSRLEEFIGYKENNQLQTPEEAAKKIIDQVIQSGILQPC